MQKAMTAADKNTIRKMQDTLVAIRDKQPVFFNVSNYEKWGLITSKKKWGKDAVGNRVVKGHTFHLTTKAKRYVNTII